MSVVQEDALLTKAVNILKKNGVISYPTEGVWGLGCDPVSYTHLTLPTSDLV